MNIPEDYFRDEEREGFFISEKMKRSWGTKLVLLTMIDEICKRGHLRWFVDYGTLLGAVRHRGFIPWDDDLDISMPREDYDKAMALFKKEMPACCHIRRYARDGHRVALCTYINNREHIDAGESAEEAKITQMFFGNPFRDGIDVFPLDYIPKDTKKRESLLSIVSRVYDVLHDYDRLKETRELKRALRELERVTGHRVVDHGDGEGIGDVIDALAARTRREDSIGVENLVNMAGRTSERWRELAWYEDSVRLPFEMIEVPVPIGYMELLRSNFGANWVSPVRGTASHDYPFYKKQELWIRQRQAQKVIDKAEEAGVAGRRGEMLSILGGALSQYADCYSLYFALAKAVLNEDIELARDFLNKALAICEEEEYRVQIQGLLDRIDAVLSAI